MKTVTLLACGLAVSLFAATAACAQPAAGIALSPRNEVSLADIQKARAALDGPQGYYTRAYSKAETSYWEKLPVWMAEDRSRRKVRRVLDIGCGYGTLLAYAAAFYRAAGYCMDVTEYLIPQFRIPRNLVYAKGNVELDPIPWREPFDLIIMTEVLEHFNFQPVPTLRKIHDALAPGGLFLLSTPNQEKWGKTTKYYQRLQDLPQVDRSRKIVDDHIWQYDERELRNVLDDAGFAILKFDYSTTENHRHFNVMATRK
jgi:SAM-dependent methyltransferase